MARPPYPPFRGPRQSVIEAARAGAGRVAGRLTERGEGRSFSINDASGEIPLASASGEAAGPGDWVSGRLRMGDGGELVLDEIVILAPRTAASPDPDLQQKLPLLYRRASVLDAARTFFRERGFLEVETPARVLCPGLEPHLVAFPAGGGLHLITSPELHLKRLVAAGAERVVELARVFRDEERGRWHRPEFLMIEWYRAFAGLDAIESDAEQLVSACAAAAGVRCIGDCELSPPFERTTVRQVMHQHGGIDLANLTDRAALARAIAERGHVPSPDDTWDDLFHRVWATDVEPHLGASRPVFVHDYPASQSALARIRHEPSGDVAERFELYIAGVEIANAFHELNDPAEQRRRHEADQEARRAAGRAVYPLDERFLGALASGMPPTSGIALGFDRLAALLLGASAIDEITAFP